MEIRGPMPLSCVRSSGAALASALAAAFLAPPAGLDAFWLYFMRPCQSPRAANDACIGQVPTLAGGTMSPSWSARRISGSFASASAA